jgi:murein DD-endopeptidase MepM/ murein hydrolase activator NlpD
MVNGFLSGPRFLRGRTGVQLVGLCAVLAVALSVGLVPLGWAGDSRDKKQLDADIARLRTELEGTSQDLAQAFVDLHRTKAELPGARQALSVADGALVAADRRNQAVATALAVAQANEAKEKDALIRNTRQSQEIHDQIVNLARDDYQQGGVSGLSIALGATSPADFTDGLIMMDTVMRIRRATLRGLDAKRVEGRATQAHLSAVSQQVAALKVEAEAALAQAAAARKTAAAAKTRLDLLVSAQTRYAATVAAKKSTEAANLDKMQAQSEELGRVLAARAKAAREAAARSGRQPAPRSPSVGSPKFPSAPQGSGGFLSYPSSARVSSEFGMRFHPVLRISRLHAGIDFAAPCGSPVYAAAAGYVIMTSTVGQSGGYGNRLVIDHGLQRGVDLTTTYNHLTSFVVTHGRVARGQLVAHSGTTGLSTGCHLHFETRQDGTPVNPRLWF